jgi:lipoprotein NlpI
MKLNPYHTDSLNTLGHILWKKKDYNAAKQCFETVIEKDPNNVKSL